MINNTRFWASSLVGIIIVLAAMAMMGLGLGSVIQLTSVFIVTGFALSFLFILRDTSSIYSLCRVFFSKSNLKLHEESNIFAVIETLGRASKTAGVIGAVMGLLHAAANYTTPDLIGPSIFVGLVCLLYGHMFNAFIVVPAKFAWVAKNNFTENQPSEVFSFSGKQTIGFLCGISLAMLGIILEGGNVSTYLSITSLIVMLAPIVSCYLVKPDSSIPSPHRQQDWFREAWVSGAAIAVVLNIMVIMQNLDKPALIGSLIGNAALPLLYGAVGAFLLGRSPLVKFSSQMHSD